MADVLISKSRSQEFIKGIKPPSTPSFINGENPNPVDSGGDTGSGAFVPYSGATGDVDLGTHSLLAESITLDPNPATIPTDQGSMYFDETRQTVAMVMNGTLQHIGQDSYFYVKNSSGATITKGTCVGFAGTDGGSGHLLISKFLANGSSPSTYFMGVTAEDIANGEFGQVTHFGELMGINTSAFTAGALLYASSTVAGAFQTTAPISPNNIILVAAAVNSKNNGAIIVRPQIGSNINNDEGVKITSPTAGQLLQLQSNGLWENKTIPVHNPVTLGTANGLSLSTQILSLGLASGSTTGALSSTDWNTFNNKEPTFTKNTGFNKNFGTAAGTVAQGNDSRILNGQTAFGWGNHVSAGYALASQLHNPVTIGTANGLSLTGQALSLGLASGSTNGALSSTDWNTFNNKISSQWITSGSNVYYNGGNVGIGTSSPAGKLDIDGGLIVRGGGDILGGTATSDYGNLTLRGGYAVATNLASKIEIRGFEGGGVTQGAIISYTNGTERMRIMQGGNVLIGTTTDNGAKLQVNGDITTSAPNFFSADKWKLGNATTLGPTIPDTWVTVQIGSKVYKLLAHDISIV